MWVRGRSGEDFLQDFEFLPGEVGEVECGEWAGCVVGWLEAVCFAGDIGKDAADLGEDFGEGEDAGRVWGGFWQMCELM